MPSLGVPRLVLVVVAVSLAAAGAAGPAVAVRREAVTSEGFPAAEGTLVVLPVDGQVTRLFVRPAQRWSPGHRGIDLAAEPGTPVRSPLTGTVEFAGPVAGRTVLTVVREDGLRCSLEPLTDVAEAGTPVRAGDVVGLVAEGHCPTAPCVHWGARRDGDYVDPLGLLAPVTTVLLPWP